MFKVFLVTLLLTSTGVEKSEEIFIGDILPEDGFAEESPNYRLCKEFARQREFTYRTPPEYLGTVHLCELR